jgi:hypothetical protein
MNKGHKLSHADGKSSSDRLRGSEAYESALLIYVLNRLAGPAAII